MSIIVGSRGTSDKALQSTINLLRLGTAFHHYCFPSSSLSVTEFGRISSPWLNFAARFNRAPRECAAEEIAGLLADGSACTAPLHAFHSYMCAASSLLPSLMPERPACLSARWGLFQPPPAMAGRHGQIWPSGFHISRTANYRKLSLSPAIYDTSKTETYVSLSLILRTDDPPFHTLIHHVKLSLLYLPTGRTTKQKCDGPSRIPCRRCEL